jgi:hypothetical protein
MERLEGMDRRETPDISERLRRVGGEAARSGVHGKVREAIQQLVARILVGVDGTSHVSSETGRAIQAGGLFCTIMVPGARTTGYFYGPARASGPLCRGVGSVRAVTVPTSIACRTTRWPRERTHDNAGQMFQRGFDPSPGSQRTLRDGHLGRTPPPLAQAIWHRRTYQKHHGRRGEPRRS